MRWWNSQRIRGHGGGRGVGRGVFAFGEAVFEPALDVGERRIGHVVEMHAGFGETAGGHFDPGQMEGNAFALVVVVGDLERVRPRPERVIGAERANAVIAFRVNGREQKILRIQLHGLAIQREGLVENLLLADVVKRPRVLAEKTNHGREILVIHRLRRIQFDGFGVIHEGVGDRAMFAVIVGELVPHRRIFRVELRGFPYCATAASSSPMSFKKLP